MCLSLHMPPRCLDGGGAAPPQHGEAAPAPRQPPNDSTRHAVRPGAACLDIHRETRHRRQERSWRASSA
jgi:hypothetical protein